MGGRPVLNEDLVNLPNWLVLKLRIEGDDAIGLDNVELLEYRHEYDVATRSSPGRRASVTWPGGRPASAVVASSACPTITRERSNG
jgi:trehalose/maltose hydrolase-like predicted phosphorylase